MGKRRQPSDTAYYHFYNANPKGKITTDCVFRAIAVGMDKSWQDVMMEMTALAIKYGYVPTDTVCINKYLKRNGWVKQKQPRWEDGTKYTGKDFCQLYHFKTDEKVIATIGYHHITVFKNCKIWDTWNCSDRCIGSYWTYGGE